MRVVKFGPLHPDFISLPDETPHALVADKNRPNRAPDAPVRAGRARTRTIPTSTKKLLNAPMNFPCKRILGADARIGRPLFFPTTAGRRHPH